METPSSFMFADLRTFAGITNKEAAKELLTDQTTYGGATPRNRIDERTFLSRQVVHVLPSQVHPEFFGDFLQSAQTITGKIVSNLAVPNAYEAAIQHYGCDAAINMAKLLNLYSLDGNLYANAVKRINAGPLPSEADKAVLLVMMFLISGSLGNPGLAVKTARHFMEQKLSVTFSTLKPQANDPSRAPNHASDAGTLGLIRIDNGMACSPLYPLSSNAEGTTIGLLATGDAGINDVGLDVSRNHLRIFKQGNAWFAQGLGSTNGTTLISGSKGTAITLEEGAANRSNPSKPVQIQHGDTLCLGNSTKFLVMKTAQ